MSVSTFTELTNRALLRVAGDEAREFLQGLVTCDVTQLTPGDINFGALLSPQGKILFDFFIIGSTNGFMIDVEKSMLDDLMRRLIFYRLRAKIDIEPMDDRTQVFAIWGGDPSSATILADGVIGRDPRLADMGMRAYIRRAPDNAAHKPHADWDQWRVHLGMPEGGKDFSFGDAFPHEALMDQFKGVDFAKGCYVGQEVVSRMQHRGTARKRFIQVFGSDTLPDQGTEILAGGKAVGVITSAVGKQGIANIRLDRASGFTNEGDVMAGSSPVSLKIQDWCNFDWPES